MKKPKNRPITPLLIKQLYKQEERIKQCGIEAMDWCNNPSDKGTIFKTLKS